MKNKFIVLLFIVSLFFLIGCNKEEKEIKYIKEGVGNFPDAFFVYSEE